MCLESLIMEAGHGSPSNYTRASTESSYIYAIQYTKRAKKALKYLLA